MAYSIVKNIQSRFIKHHATIGSHFKSLEVEFDRELINIFETEDLAEKTVFRTAYKQTPHSLKVKVIKAVIDFNLNQFIETRWRKILIQSHIPVLQKKGEPQKSKAA